MWLALAEAEAELGLPITPSQLDQMRSHLDTIDFVKAAAFERQTRHDVFAHLHTFGDDCPDAKPIMHLGATSAYVTDNTDLFLIRESLDLATARLATVIERLAIKANETKSIICLGRTHLQPAQPTTIGKRICLWILDLLLDLEDGLRWSMKLAHIQESTERPQVILPDGLSGAEVEATNLQSSLTIPRNNTLP